MPEPIPFAPPPATIEQLRAGAASVRAAADEIDRRWVELCAYERPDVWQGARATDLHEGLAAHTTALRAPDFGAIARLRDAARRIDARADALHDAATQAVFDELARTAPESG